MTESELAALEARLSETKFHADWALAFKELFAAVRRVNAAEQTMELRHADLAAKLAALEGQVGDVAATVARLERGLVGLGKEEA